MGGTIMGMVIALLVQRCGGLAFTDIRFSEPADPMGIVLNIVVGCIRLDHRQLIAGPLLGGISGSDAAIFSITGLLVALLSGCCGIIMIPARAGALTLCSSFLCCDAIRRALRLRLKVTGRCVHCPVRLDFRQQALQMVT
jgi:hypothetical protein